MSVRQADLHTSGRTGQKAETFAMLVDSVLAVPGRDLVAVAGVLKAGQLPMPGTHVSIAARSRPPLSAQVAGGPAFDVQLPRLSFLLKGVRAADIPEGAQITLAAFPA
jgi:hypothetical protein